MRRRILRDVILVGLMGLSSLWLVFPAFSQGTPPQRDSGQQVSDKELRAFAKAYVEYHKVRQRYESTLSKAKDPAEKEKIQQEGNRKAEEAVERQGLSVESYNRIFGTINGNEELRKKALNLIDEERKKSS